jgi:Flp pilus assembly protein TadG
MNSRMKSFWKKDTGSALIETAVAYIMMMTCVLGIIEFSMMTYTYAVYADAARHGVRYATIHGSDSSNCSGPTTGCGDPTGAKVISAIKTYAQPFVAPISGSTITVSYPDAAGCTPPSRVIVNIAYTYVPLFRYPSSTIKFQVSSQGRILY